MKRVAAYLSLLVIIFGCTELILRYTVTIQHWEGAPVEFLKLQVHLRDDGAWDYQDFVSQSYNVRDGIRVTTDTPFKYNGRVLLFGNSTLLGIFVSDRETSASNLQRKLNSGGYSLKVENYAVSGMRITQELLRLRSVTLHSGDIVVFTDGAMEEYDSHNCINEGGQVTFTTLYLACDVVNFLPRPKVASIVANYKYTLETVAFYCRERNVTFIHILQPRPWIDQAFYDAYGSKPPLIPRQYFLDEKHLSTEGEVIESGILFDAITEF